MATRNLKEIFANTAITLAATSNDHLMTPIMTKTQTDNILNTKKFIRLDLNDSNYSASFRMDVSNNLAMYVGAGSAADGSQINFAQVVKTTGDINFTGKVKSWSGQFYGGGETGYSLMAPGNVTDSSAFVARGSGSSYNPSGIEIFAGGLERVRVMPSGNVGFGTGTPNDRLHVTVTPALTGLTKYGFRATTAGTEYGARFLGYLDQGVGSGVIIETIDAGTTTERLRINTSGNMGLGGAPTTHRLASYGPVGSFITSGQTAFEIYNTSVNKAWAIYPNTNGSNSDLGFYSNSGTPGVRMYMQGASGNVGIGTSAPTFGLHVNGQTSGTGPVGAPDIADNKSSTIAVVSAGNLSGSGGSIEFGGGATRTHAAIRGSLISGNNNSSGHLDFYTRVVTTDTAMNHVMRLTNTGNVGIRNTTPLAPLQVNGAARFGGVSGTTPTVAAYNGSGVGVIEAFEGGTSTNKLPLALNAFGGNVGIGTTNPGRTLEVQDNTNGGTVRFRHNSTFSEIAHLSDVLYITNAAATGVTSFWNGGAERLCLRENGVLRPGADNTQTFGNGTYRWSVIYAGTGTINTSDARWKTTRDGKAIKSDNKASLFTDAEIAAAKELSKEIGVYKWQDSVKEKGDDARLHIGMTVQRAIEIMESHGLEPFSYGFICKDEITKKVRKKVKKKVQKTETKEEIYTEIEIIDGVPTQVEKTRTTQVPVTKLVDIVDSKGEKVLGEDGKAKKYPVPVMVNKTVEEEVDEADGFRYGFRYDQLTLFILAGITQ